VSDRVEFAPLTLTALNGIYLRLDTTNDPLTGTLDGANLDFTGHAAIGADASVGVYTLLDLDETLVFRDTTGYGIFADLYLEPPGVLSASTHLVAMDMQAQWNGGVDGSVHASVQGIKGEGINRAAAQPINEIVGVYGKASNLGISDVTEAIAGLFFVTNDDAIGTELGDITNAYSILARAYTDKDTGVITNRYGLYIEDITGGGTTTNQYGIYCPALVGGGINLFINNISAASNFGSGNIVTTGTLGAGESTLDRLGVHTSPNATSTIYTREIFTEVDCGRKGIHSDPELQPSGALGGITTLHGAILQSHWETIEDGSTYGYLYGTEGTVHTDFISGGGSGDLLSAIGLWGRVRHRSDGDITTAIGVLGDIQQDDDLTELGAITSAYSFLARASTDKNAVITDRYGLYIEDTSGGGGLTNQYGIYCPALTGGGTTNLFIKNISANSDFGSGDIDTTGAITASEVYLTDFDSGNEGIAHLLNDTVNCSVLHAITITDETGINISWDAGVIWDCIGEATIETDAHASTGCTDNQVNYLYWDRSGGGTALTLSTTRPDYDDDDVLAGIIVCQSGDIYELHTVNLAVDRETKISTAISDILQVVVTDGLIVSEDTDATNAFDVEISAGTFYHFGTTRHNLATGFNTRTTAMTRWYHSSGVWTNDSNAQIDMTEGTAGINRYDNLTDRVDGSAPKYYKSIFMYSENMIHWIYPQAEYDTIAQAIAAPLPTIPAVGEFFPRSVSVVMKGNDAAFPTAGGTRWIDIRPLFGTSITGIITDHGNLAGLLDDDHSQYPLLVGRSGGQVLIGGTGVTDDLTLQTTSGVGTTGADMHFLVGNAGATEAMTILNSGNVGIGTTGPGTKLEVVDTAANAIAYPLSIVNSDEPSPGEVGQGAGITFSVGGTIDGGSSFLNLLTARIISGKDSDYYQTGYADVDGNLQFQTILAGNAVDAVRITSAGNVGIGTTGPSSKLHVVGTTDELVRITRSGVPQLTLENTSGTTMNNQILFRDNSAIQWRLGTDMSTNNNTDIFEIMEGGTPRFAIKSGNVGIGTTGPDYKLEVNGTGFFGDKLSFTQTDGNEYIDSLNDGYMDYGATTGHRFGGPSVVVSGDLTSNGTIVADDSLIIGAGTKHDGYTILPSAEVQTTDATVTVVDNITLSDENTYHVEALIVGVKTDGSQRASYHIAGTFYRTSAGNATQQGSTTLLHSEESDANWATTFTVDTNDVRVSVTGVAATTIEWGCTLKYINMSN